MPTTMLQLHFALLTSGECRIAAQTTGSAECRILQSAESSQKGSVTTKTTVSAECSILTVQNHLNAEVP